MGWAGAVPIAKRDQQSVLLDVDSILRRHKNEVRPSCQPHPVAVDQAGAN